MSEFMWGAIFGIIISPYVKRGLSWCMLEIRRRLKPYV
jgi:hypothetical protein